MKNLLFLIIIAFGSIPCIKADSVQSIPDAPTLINKQNKDNTATPVAKYGQLSVQGRYLMGEHGDTVVLRGQSYGWSQWWPQYWNEDVVQWVSEDWKIDVIRGTVGAPAFVEYDDDPKIHYDLMHTVVQAAIENGIYVIIDWHAHEIYTEEAIEFFTEFAQTYAGYPNIIYEIFNEPTTQPWDDIKAYSVAVIDAIREHDINNIILIGTPLWCQDIHIAAADPIEDYNNIMYVSHFYAESHQQWLRDRLISVAEGGLPIFVSEMSGMSYTGSGPINYDQWQQWFNLLEDLKISWVNYSLTDGNGQSCSVLLPGASISGNWTINEFDLLDPGELNESGIYLRNKLRRIQGVDLPVFPVPGIVRGVDFIDMSGMIVEGNDPESLYRGEGYGISAGSISDGNWMEYLVDVTEGHYTFHFNISSSKTGNLHILKGDNLLAEIDIPNTQGTFINVSTEEDVFLPEGQYVIRISAPTGGWRLHWWYGDDGSPVQANDISITPRSTLLFIGQNFLFQADVKPFNASNKEVEWISSDPEIATVDTNGMVTGISDGNTTIFATTVDGGFTDSATVWVLGAFELPGIVQAETYFDMYGIQTEPSTEGGLNVGYIMPGDWMDYYVNPEKDTTYLISFRVASNASGGTLQLRSGNEVLTQASIPVTGGWQNWVTVTAVADLMAGPQILRIHSLSSGWNIAWWQAEYTESSDPTYIPIYKENEWVIYPNPVKNDGFFVHSTSNNLYTHIEIKVVNSLGEVVLECKSENNPVRIDRSKIRGSGIFFIEIRTGEKKTIKKIVLH
jgi:endoglucanase